MDGVMRRVVGVMPPGFSFPGTDTRIWKPYSLDEANPAVGAFSNPGLGRMAAGMTVDVVTDEIGDEGEVHAAAVELVLVEAVAPHRYFMEVRRFLGVEDRGEEVPFEASGPGHGLSHREGDGHRGAIIVGTGGLDDAVVVGPDEDGGEVAVRTGDDPGEVDEVLAVDVVGQGEGVSTVGLAADFSESTGDPGLGSGMAGGAYHPAFRQAEGADVVFEGSDELVVVIGHDVELVWLGRRNLRLHYIR